MKRLLKLVPLFDNLSETELEHIANIGIRRGYKTGTELFRQGDAGTTFYVIISGSVKIYTKNEEGKEKIIAIFQAGDSFGEFSLIDGETRSASARTLEDSEFFTISREDFHDLIDRNFSITYKMIQQLTDRLLKTNQQVMDLVFLDAKTQIVKTFINLANEHGERMGEKIKLNVKVSVIDIADMAGIATDVTTYVIRELEMKGVLLNENGFYYLNVAALKK